MVPKHGCGVFSRQDRGGEPLWKPHWHVLDGHWGQIWWLVTAKIDQSSLSYKMVTCRAIPLLNLLGIALNQEVIEVRRTTGDWTKTLLNSILIRRQVIDTSYSCQWDQGCQGGELLDAHGRLLDSPYWGHNPP